MKWVADIEGPVRYHFEIVRTELHSIVPGVSADTAYILNVWENGRGLLDSMQDTLEDCMDVAATDFGVPAIAWKEVAEK